MMIEQATRDWLRDRSDLMGLLQGDPKRLDLDYKGPLSATHITLYRSGGAPQVYTPLETALLTFHCFGSTRNAAGTLASQLVAELRAMVMEPLDPSTKGHGARVESLNWLPTPDGTARYVVIATVTASPVAPAA